MQRYYIYEKRKGLLRIENIYAYPYYKDVIRELPLECIGYVDGVENLYETFRQMVLPYHLETWAFADSFSYSLGKRMRAAYLIVDGKGKNRGFLACKLSAGFYEFVLKYRNAPGRFHCDKRCNS